MEFNVLAIFFRWLHIISACALLGSVFFFDFLLPIGTRGMEDAASEAIYLRCRRGFKMTVHVTLLMFLISGIYNTIRNWSVYKPHPVMHGLFGVHLLFGLGALTLLMIVLAGREVMRSRAGWTRWSLIILMLGVAAASTLKSAREWAMSRPRSADPTSPQSAAR